MLTKIENIKILYYCYIHGKVLPTMRTYTNLINIVHNDISVIAEYEREPNILHIIQLHVGFLMSLLKIFTSPYSKLL